MILKRFEELRYCGNLPSPPGVGLSILRLTRDDGVPSEELVGVLETDPALAGRVLRLANSSRASRAQPVSSVATAALSLGPTVLRGAALSFTLLPAGRAGVCGQFDHELYWSHSIATALAARELAAGEGSVDPAEAFTGGLLARVGLLALATIHAEAYAQILAAARGGTPEQLLLEEARQFDIQHWEVAAAMLAEWGLPDRIVGAILSLGHSPRDHTDDATESDALAGCLRDASLVASRLARATVALEPGRAQWLDLFSPSGRWKIESGRLSETSARAAPAWRACCERLHLPSAASTDLDDDVSGGKAVSVLSGGELPGRAASAMEGGPDLIPCGELRVLAVDDDPRVVESLEHHLRAAGYRVETTVDGASALSAARAAQPHILITDWLMPGLSGIDLIRAVRSSEAGRDTYVLMLTARDDEDAVVEAFDAGADDFVRKPCNPRILLARVQAGHRAIELQRRIESDRHMRSTQVVEMGLLTRRLAVAAHTDVLTQLPNSRYALRMLEQALDDAVANDRPLSVQVIDIDHFKRINDHHGHDVGDAVLKAIAMTLREHARRPDLVCRLGGEEFLVINMDADVPASLRCAERLRDAVAANVVRAGAFSGKVTISVGVATRCASISSVRLLLKAADEALYAAKSAGRNTVRAHVPRRLESA